MTVIGGDACLVHHAWHKTCAPLLCRGEIVENVEPPLPLNTPLLLVKPTMGLATPEIFKLLDLSKCSKTKPKQLLKQMAAAGRLTQEMCINDLERPAFERSAHQTSYESAVCAWSHVYMA